jgi:predicted acylesterase/phospholipase RssA
VRLRLVTTSLRGVPSPAPDNKYTTFEQDYEFRAKDFESSERIREIAEAAVASAAIPLVFAPAKVGGRGPYWDGGVVDNAPIAWALEREPAIDHLLVVSKDPKTVTPSARFSRLSLGRLFEILIEERLTRDLREAHKFNRDLETLQGLGTEMARVRQALGWRHLEIIEIRPTRTTPGGFLSGFFSRTERVKNIESGKESARQAFEAWDADGATATGPMVAGLSTSGPALAG